MKFTDYTSMPMPSPRVDAERWMFDLVAAIEENLQAVERSVGGIGQDLAHTPTRDEASTTYTLTARDGGTVLRFSGANPAVTIPTAIYTADTEIMLRQTGTGTLTLTTTGWTVNGTLPTWAQHVETKLRVKDSTTLEVVY